MDILNSYLRHLPEVLFVLTFFLTHAHSDIQAPCMGCRLFNMGHRTPVQDQRNQQFCHYPCRCPAEAPQCQAGVNVIKDGCSCCYMCARQLGDICSIKDRCDVTKGLYCSTKDDNSTGTCLGEDKKSCKVKGAMYKDGEKFYMGCSKLCTCQNGYHGCMNLCPQERLKPSELTCHDPKLIKVKNKCCREWTCQKLDTGGQILSSDKGLESQNLIMKNPMWYRTTTTRPTTTTLAPRPAYVEMPCKAVKSEWSPCSVTCGVGVSVRLVVDKDTCKDHEERQLCYLRPCGVKLATLGRDKCTPTTRSSSKQHIRFQDCISLKRYNPKFCTTCKKNKCCYPKTFRTKSIKFQCTGGTIEPMNFMWVKKCRCSPKCNEKGVRRKQRGRKMKERRRRRRKERKRRKWMRYNKKKGRKG